MSVWCDRVRVDDFGRNAGERPCPKPSTARFTPHAAPGPKIVHNDSGAALIIAVAIFAVLLIISLTFWSASRAEHFAAVRHEEGFRTDLLAQTGAALAVAQLRLDKKWHPTYTSLDHGWNTYFDGAWLAGKPWAFRPDAFGTRVLDRTWTSWAGGAPYRRVPYIDYWAGVKVQEAELDRAIQQALYVQFQESLGSALAQIKNPLFVPRFQIGGPSLVALLDTGSETAINNLIGGAGSSDFAGPVDFPVQYAYDVRNFNLAYNDPLQIPDADYEPTDGNWPARVITPQQKINIWADVDNDGDGLRDSMWIPIGVEVFRGGVDRDRDGRVGADEGGDGIDNDLDGQVDEPDETAVFVYWGGNDGLDNDQDGNIDEADEQRVFLTAPLIADSYWGGNDFEDNDHNNNPDDDGEQRIFLTSDDRINNNAASPRVPADLFDITEAIDYRDPGESIPLLDTFHVRVNLTTLNEFIQRPGIPVTAINSPTDNRLLITNPGDPASPSIDRIDNDFTQIVNDVHGHAYLEPTTPQLLANGTVASEWVAAGAQQNRARSYTRINTDPGDPRSYPINPLVFPEYTDSKLLRVVTCSGEPVCTIAGRVAVHVVDEASKVNLNSAGAIATVSPEDVDRTTASGSFAYLKGADRLTFAHNEGISNGEYDARVLPGIGINFALDVAMTRTGEHRPTSDGGKPQNFPVLNPVDANDSDANNVNDNAAESGYAYDAYFPGYGRTDDNANMLQLQFDGLDNDGDGAYYTHDGVDNDGDGVVDEPDEARFGIDEPFEGLDEPLELQIFRPLRNRLAELDGLDNNHNGVVDEIGELGDRLYNTGDEMAGALSSVAQIAPLRPVITVQSNEANARYQHYIGGAQGDLARNIPPDTAPVTGMRLDYNVALPDSIVNALKEDWSYPSTDDVLRNEVTLRGGNPYQITDSIYLKPPYVTSPPDPWVFQTEIGFQAAYLAGLRRESMSIIGAPIGILDERNEPPLSASPAPPGPVLEADAGLRAYQLALNIVDARDTDHIRNTATYRQGDQWWAELFRDASIPPGTAAPATREISYTMAGTEGIRINEIMVRPVRRVEAEVDIGGQPETSPNVFSDGPVDFDVIRESITDRIPTATPNGTEWSHFSPGGARVGLGILAGFTTDATEATDGGNTYDNVIQFRIGPSAQLPPGRYYLLLNSIGADGRPTVVNTDDIDFRVKYALNNPATDILADVAANPITGPGTGLFVLPAITPSVQPDPIIGYRNQTVNGVAGMETGFVFLPTRDVREAPGVLAGLGVNVAAYYGIPGEPELQNEAFTVIVPPFAANPADQYYLYIAIRKNNNPGVPIAVNFFDFSQEPDHEWIELANVSASPNPIDLTGYLLEVGGGPNDPTRMVYSIPAGTQIAPNGTLLLTTNKYDAGSGAFTNPGQRIFAANGIGMASVPARGVVNGGISEPPIPRYATPGEDGFVVANHPALGADNWNGRWGEPLGSGTLGAQSDFQRVTPTDFIDRDGDGLADGVTDDDLVISTVDVPGSDLPTKAWDRIVQIEPIGSSPLKNVFGANALNDIAEMVLRGGIFPNYPEEDLVDNDGDNADLMRDGIDNNGNRYIFDHDGIDNDGDGLVDEGANGLDNNGNELIDELAESEGVDELGEGIDEGGFLREAKRLAVMDPGSFPGLILAYLSTDAVPGTFDRQQAHFLFLDSNAPDNEPAWVKGVGSNPEWKEFTERRYYPGDCVRVTLYQGRPEEEFVVDRVTYTQNDVENRAPDDVLNAENVVAGGVPLTFADRFRMFNEVTGYGLERAWPENTMGVDFYRSLERKHPLYPGDRFGLANRWTATDGNYDDWAPGTNRYFFDTITDTARSMMSDMQVGPVATPTTVSGVRLFAHGFSGSPLRANFFQRVLEDPDFGYSPDPPVRLAANGARVVDNALVIDNQRILARARVRDANFRSQGDLLTVPHMTLSRTYQQDFIRRDVLGREALQGPFTAPEDMLPAVVPAVLKGASIGTDFPKDLRALNDIASMDSIALNVGQADFYPLYPYLGALATGGQVELAQWRQVAAGQYRAPVAWSPVFLASLDPTGSEPEGADFAGMQTVTLSMSTIPQYPNLAVNWPGYPIQLAFLYRNADLGLVPPYTNTTWLLQDNVAPPGSLAAVRWPLERRAMMYVSTNPDGFRPEATSHDITPPTGQGAAPYPSEALFVWDGADGLPNGEYDVYVVTMPDLSNLVRSTRAFDPNRNDWLAAKLETVRRRLPVDIQVFTDKDGDRKCWLDGRAAVNPTAGMPDTVELGLNTQSTSATDKREAYPLKAGLVPVSDGSVHYGVVKVENNFLGVFVRNWSTSNIDNVNAFSRVILMSRDKTPGRINVNTAITQPIAENLTGNPDYNAFNPLTGLVGFMAEYTPTPNTDFGRFTPVPWSDLPGGNGNVATGPPYTFAPGTYSADLRRANSLVGPWPDPIGGTPVFLPRGFRYVDYNNDGVPDDLDSNGVPELTLRFDGRYLLTPGELIVGGDEGAFEARPLLLMPSVLSQPVDFYNTPRDANTKAQQFDELKERYARSANSLTAVSDTFEIYVTAQSGYCFDANRDGVLNWRDDAEFRVTGEKKSRTVYER